MPSMGSRKRVKPSPPGADSKSPTASDDGATSLSAGGDHAESRNRGSTASWYPAVWPAVSRASKAAPVTEVARESISAAQNLAPRLTSRSTPQLDSPRSFRNPSLQLTRKVGASSRSLPADAATTKINIASDGTTFTPEEDAKSCPAGITTQPTEEEVSKDQETVIATDDADKGQLSAAPESTTDDNRQSADANPTSTPSEESPANPPVLKDEEQATSEDQGQREPDRPEQDKPDEAHDNSQNTLKRSWLQMWYGSSTKGPEEPASKPPDEVDKPTTQDVQTEPAPTQDQDTQGASSPATIPPVKDPRPSGWSFWFKESSKGPDKEGPQDSQVASASILPDASLKKATIEAEPESEARAEIAKKGSVKLKNNKSSTALPDKTTLRPEAGPNDLVPGPSEAAASKQLRKVLPNQVLPRFHETFAMQEKPSLLQTIGRYFHYGKELNSRHVHMVKDTPPIKRALAIGIHGYFPAPLIRSVLGQPTGTSIRFSNMAAEAINTWADDHGYKCDIEKIALEGEGRIAERVDLLWKLLLNWMEEIRKADFILVACHSQGVPVAIMLVAKLISFGCLNAARVGVCAMAGVNLGPFADFRSRWISGSAGELFEFALPYSQVSKDYESALRTCLDFGIRISYIGSIDDQLVSLESSLFAPVTHPYIYRAAFVDGRVHAPSFLSHLVGFVLKLRNLGIPDHGLIRELSSPLAGSLYSGEGHSRLYDDPSVYRLAIEFALETSTIHSANLHIKRTQPAPANPYILPFAMRGILEEEYVRRELYDETMELLRQFDDWKPTSKVLKDVKFRLEGIRSKL
ncbi:Spb1 C-terminal domain family protein [Aspergillus niger]|uniref:Spb1 C-terminal domain family protein n=1 Tax=Aspergillus niger TaxID=5061 RepID=A0A505HNT7_ASPNG|nr:Spb1 C-terminal domain family protein [Aspergillus niger]